MRTMCILLLPPWRSLYLYRSGGMILQTAETNKGQKKVFSAIDDNRIPKCQVCSLLYPLSIQAFINP